MNTPKDSRELRQAFLDFFASKDHRIVESSSLIPDNDPTLLFTNAGMVQFKDALALREKRDYSRAASCQRCVRAGGKHNDLDNVGYTARHHTFFEMLGNFSFGDYFKKEAVQYSWEFLTKVVKIPIERLWVTVHLDDDDAYRIWTEEIGFDPKRISRLGDDDNFWTMGDTGPCGPSSEIFYDHGEGVPGGPPGSPNSELDRYIEIWNLVFTQFERKSDGTLIPLPKPCVDTGMGLERLAAVQKGVHNNYDIDTFIDLRVKVADLLGISDNSNSSIRVISDHIRSAAFLIADGVLPSNAGRGYVLRRIIRRALRHGHKLKAQDYFFSKLVGSLVKQMGDVYPLLAESEAHIEKILQNEESKFDETLDQGMKILSDVISELSAGDEIPGDIVFRLYDTYGFPADLTEDIVRERDLVIDTVGFNQMMQKQKELARSASKFNPAELPRLTLDYETEFTGYDRLSDKSQILALVRQNQTVKSCSVGDECSLIVDVSPFYAESGGQVGDVGRFFGDGLTVAVNDTVKYGQTIVHKGQVIEGRVSVGDTLKAEVDDEKRKSIMCNHSATHLLHAALRRVLGDHITQRGSLVRADRLRFDFSHFDPVSQDDLLEVEKLVNQKVLENTIIQTKIMPIDEARSLGAMALFDEKYSDKVRVLEMGSGFSLELCGGTHASRTGDIGMVQLLEEKGIASGIRRIEAISGNHVADRLYRYRQILRDTASLLRINEFDDLIPKTRSLVDENKRLEKENSKLNIKLVSAPGSSLSDEAIELENGVKLVVKQLDQADTKSLPIVLDKLKNSIREGVVVLASINEERIDLIAGVTKELTSKVNAGQLINYVAGQIGGKGGGRADMARAGGSDIKKLPEALRSVDTYVRERL